MEVIVHQTTDASRAIAPIIIHTNDAKLNAQWPLIATPPSIAIIPQVLVQPRKQMVGRVQCQIIVCQVCVTIANTSVHPR